MDMITSIASYEKFWLIESSHSTAGSHGLVASALIPGVVTGNILIDDFLQIYFPEFQSFQLFI
jgi:hypothetical protein